jgi:hypothetical protein
VPGAPPGRGVVGVDDTPPGRGDDDVLPPVVEPLGLDDHEPPELPAPRPEDGGGAGERGGALVGAAAGPDERGVVAGPADGRELLGALVRGADDEGADDRGGDEDRGADERGAEDELDDEAPPDREPERDDEDDEDDGRFSRTPPISKPSSDPPASSASVGRSSACAAGAAVNASIRRRELVAVMAFSTVRPGDARCASPIRSARRMRWRTGPRSRYVAAMSPSERRRDPCVRRARAPGPRR